MLSVVVVNWNTRDLLESCLSSIQRFPPGEEFEVIVVENDSSDGSAEMVKQRFTWVKLVEPGSNTGYAHGNNLGIKVSKGEFVLTLNPDTEFEDLSLNTALRDLRDSSGYGVLGLQLVGPDKEIQKSVRGFPTILGVLGAWTKLDRVFPATVLGSYSLPGFDYAKSGPAPQPMGTFLLFRRTALETLPNPETPFDESFPIFFNEVDLLFRLKEAGWPCWYSAEAHVLHHHGASTRQARKSMIWESHRSLVRYFKKHQRGAGRLLVPVIAAAAWVSAFVKAKGHHAGFRPDHHNL